MKKRLLTLCLALSICGIAAADEGMWLLPWLERINAGMQREGLQLTPEQIYSAEGSSLKDAVVQFGPGCTGEVVSPDGLLFTNHHCGYGSIQALSSVEHDYLKNGFWARSREEEIPVPGLTVRFVRSIAEVTDAVLRDVPASLAGEEREERIRANTERVTRRLEKRNKGMSVQVKPFFGGNSYFAFVIETYEDVRLVGTPPSSIGKFGGETDNWMWPRHTCDFSLFRIYSNKEGRPALYSLANVPYKSPVHLTISLRGVEAGDYTMIMGFPGTTTRYMTSWEIGQMLGSTNPSRIFIRGERQRILREAMEASDRVRIQYAAKYAQSSNYWKNAIGMSRGLRKLGVEQQKQAQERAFAQWAAQQTGLQEPYAEALPAIERAVEALTPIQHAKLWLQEALVRSCEMLQVPDRTRPAAPAPSAEELKGPLERGRKFYKDYDEALDRRVTERMIGILRENLRPDELPSFYAEIVDGDFGGDIPAFVEWLYEESVFANLAKFEAFMAAYDPERWSRDPAVRVAASVAERMADLTQAERELKMDYESGHRLYVAGLQRMQPEKMWYPDANFSLRLTYGSVAPYEPRDGVVYKHYTTLKGVIEKEDASNPTDFTVPERLKELYAAGDFGRYANARGELPVAFISDNDITGGNSGSPVLDARGRLVGLAFDGNWEAMSGDVAFEPDLQRCISVDIRYVLFIIDRFAGAGYLLDEMTIED